MNRNLCFLNFQICIKGQTTNLIYSPCSLSFTHSQPQQWASQMALVVKNLPANAGDAGWIPGSGRSPGGSTATHSSVLVWRMPWGGGAKVHRVAKNWTQLKRFSMHAHSIVSKTKKKILKMSGIFGTEAKETEVPTILNSLGLFPILFFPPSTNKTGRTGPRAKNENE